MANPAYPVMLKYIQDLQANLDLSNCVPEHKLAFMRYVREKIPNTAKQAFDNLAQFSEKEQSCIKNIKHLVEGTYAEPSLSPQERIYLNFIFFQNLQSITKQYV